PIPCSPPPSVFPYTTLFRSVLDLVAQSPHGHQVLGLARILFDLCAQPFDVHVERLGVADVVRAPHPFDQLLAGEYPAGVAQQELDRKSTRLNSSHVSISYAV